MGMISDLKRLFKKMNEVEREATKLTDEVLAVNKLDQQVAGKQKDVKLANLKNDRTAS